MTASGPFAMGPSQAGRSTDRVTTFSSVDSVAPSRLTLGLSQTGPPLLGKESKRGKEKETKVEEEEVYSDPDDGVEIVDMDQVQKIDWMAPDVVRKERRSGETKIKQENLDNISMSFCSYILYSSRFTDPDAVDVDPSQALDLTESEDEELEDFVQSFTAKMHAEPVRSFPLRSKSRENSVC